MSNTSVDQQHVSEDSVLQLPPVRSVDEAIERMEHVTAAIGDSNSAEHPDGLGCFNYLYTVITKRVRQGITDGFFADNAFLSQLDIDFANRYFDALRVWSTNRSATPKSWKVLLERRSRTDIESIQFAVAGVNAHVNFDLAHAVVMTCTALRTDPNHGTQHSDYLKINQIFAEEMQVLRQHYESDLAREVDSALSPVLNMVCDWSVEAARDAAWEAAEHLWSLRRFDVAEGVLSRQLDGLASLSGHLLLTAH